MNVNLIQNPGFENNDAWTPYCTTSGNTYAYVNSDYHSGSRCMKLSSAANSGWSAIRQTVSLQAGKTYTLSFYAKRTTTDIWVATFTTGAMQHKPSLMSVVGTTYTKVNQAFSVAGSGVIPVTLYIITGSVAGSAWVDDVSLLETINDPITPSGTDAVENGNFENGTTAWQLDSNISLSSGGYNGGHCLLYADSASHAARQDLDLVPGGDYTVAYIAKRTGGVGIQPTIQYTKADGTPGFVYDGTLYYEILPVYKQQLYHFTLPATAQNGAVRLAMNVYNGQGSGQLWLDQVMVCGPAAPSSSNLSVDEYINNLQSYCNCGWTYASGYNLANKTIDCANYPYEARNEQGAHACTTEYNGYLSSKGTISSLGGYDNLERGMEIFQQDADDSTKKGHMGVYAGMVEINGTVQHAVYQSCTSHDNIDAKYNNGVSEDSGPNLTGMNSKWKYWGWSQFVDHE